MESIWANPDPDRPGEHILPTWWAPKYGHYYEIYPNDVEVVREGMETPESIHAFPADPGLLDAASRAASNLKLGLDASRLTVARASGKTHYN